jgi:hypothetical protein
MSAPDIAAIVEQIAALKARRDAVLAPDPYADRSNPGAYAEAGDLTSEIAALERKRADLEAQRKADLAKLHIARKDLGLDDETWGLLVARVARGGRTCSSGALDAAERAVLLRTLRGSGWRPRPRRGRTTAGKREMLDKIGAQLTDQRLPARYAEAILCRQRGLTDGVSCPLEAATDEELRGVIAALWRRAKGQRKTPA